MAEVNVSALAVVTPAAQRNPGNQNTPKPAEQSDQPSFAQVLKSRSQTKESPKPEHAKAPSGKPAEATDKPAQTTSDSASEHKELSGASDTEAAIQTLVIDPALLFGNAAMLQAAASAQSPQQSTDTTSTDTSASESPFAANSQGILAAATAALAAQPASLAGKRLPDTPGNAASSSTEIGRRSEATPALSLPAQTSTQESSRNTQTDTDKSAQDLTQNIGHAGDTAKHQATPGEEQSGSAFARELAAASQSQGVESATPQATHGVLAAQQPGRSSEALPRHEISTPVATRGWAEEVGQKVSWVAGRDNGRAELILTPPSMGRVEISISMSGDQATANFVTASPAAREALQDAMPRLREVLAQSGINLGQANVNAGNSGQAQADNPGSRASSSRFGARTETTGSIDGMASTQGSWSKSGKGIVDTFA